MKLIIGKDKMSGCSNLESDNKQFLKCKECSKLGNPVKRITVEHLLKQEKIDSIQDSQYFFCSTSDCNVVYFSENVNFYKADLKVRVGVKETEEPIPVKEMPIQGVFQPALAIGQDKGYLKDILLKKTIKRKRNTLLRQVL